MRPLFEKQPPRLVDDWPHQRREILRALRRDMTERLPVLRRALVPGTIPQQRHDTPDGVRVARITAYKVARTRHLNTIGLRHGVEAERCARDSLRRREFFGAAVKLLLKNRG
jgi:hypothetical protein